MTQPFPILVNYIISLCWQPTISDDSVGTIGIVLSATKKKGWKPSLHFSLLVYLISPLFRMIDLSPIFFPSTFHNNMDFSREPDLCIICLNYDNLSLSFKWKLWVDLYDDSFVCLIGYLWYPQESSPILTFKSINPFSKSAKENHCLYDSDIL